MKIFISQPMNGLSDEEILKRREFNINMIKMQLPEYADVEFIAYIGPLLTIDALLEANISEYLVGCLLIDSSLLKSVNEAWDVDRWLGIVVGIGVTGIDLKTL
jgi:hypothetical protein